MPEHEHSAQATNLRLSERKAVTIRLSEELMSELRAMARSEGRTMSSIVEEALRRVVGDDHPEEEERA